MVNAHNVVELAHAAHPLHPPVVAAEEQVRPAVERIAPHLPISGEVVRRHTRDALRRTVLVQLENLRLRPCVRAVLGDVNRHVAEKLNPLAVAVSLEFLPLAEENELAEDVVAHILVEHHAVLQQRFLPAHLDALVWPLTPHDAAEMLLDGGEQREVAHPALVTQKLANLRQKSLFALMERFAQQLLLVLAHLVKFHPLILRGHKFFTGVKRQQTIRHQLLGGNQHWIARVDAERLVRRFTVAGRSHRQHLPQLHAACFQKVRKRIGFLAQTADAACTGQGRDVHQNTAFAHESSPSFREKWRNRKRFRKSWKEMRVFHPAFLFKEEDSLSNAKILLISGKKFTVNARSCPTAAADSPYHPQMPHRRCRPAAPHRAAHPARRSAYLSG